MKLCIAGAGWVTPLGNDISLVWDYLVAGKAAQPEKISDPIGEKNYIAFRVPDTFLKILPAHPRLRRASAISRFAAGAGLAALENAGLSIGSDRAGRTALIFAVANGGVIYTKRFYHDIVASGADAASPLLFPETVFNAAASHLAAILGITGISYTVVGDGAVGLLAMKMAEDLMADPELDYCLVVAAEEADWLLCDAYQKWRVLRSKPPVEPFGKPAQGTILSEGAGAIVLAREGRVQLDAIHATGHYPVRTEATRALGRALRQVATPDTTVVIASANGTFIDEAERSALSEIAPQAVAYSAKHALGESVAAGGLWQVIIAAEVLQRQKLPRPWLSLQSRSRDPGTVADLLNCRHVAVACCGLNQQVAALRLAI